MSTLATQAALTSLHCWECREEQLQASETEIAESKETILRLTVSLEHLRSQFDESAQADADEHTAIRNYAEQVVEHLLFIAFLTWCWTPCCTLFLLPAAHVKKNNRF